MRATDDVNLARTVLTALAVLCGLILILLIERPRYSWAGVGQAGPDLRHRGLVALMLLAFCVVMIIPSLRGWFELSPLAIRDAVIVVLVAATWAIGFRYIWTSHLFERALGIGDFNSEMILSPPERPEVDHAENSRDVLGISGKGGSPC